MMNGNNLAVVEYQQIIGRDIPLDYQELLKENRRLRLENQNLHQENEKLREVFSFATIEFEKRNQERESLRAENKRLQEENALLKKRLEEEVGKNSLLAKLAFGDKSEKSEERITVEHKSRGAVTGHKGRGRKIPQDLPKREETIDLPEKERFCPDCGLPYQETGMEKVSSEIDVEKRYYVKFIRRKTYKKTCTCPHPLVTAPSPGKLIPKGKFAVGFWVDVLVNKYYHHLPVERQVKEMADYGLAVGSGTIFGGLHKIFLLYLAPLYKGMAQALRGSYHLHADETGWKLFVFIDDKENYRWFIWVFVSKNMVLFVLHPTRSAQVPARVLFDIDITEMDKDFLNPKVLKLLSVDKFSSYKALQNIGLVELAFCWSHQRREFLNLKTKYPQVTDWVDEWVERIGTLYHINNQRIVHPKGDPFFKKYDQELKEKIDKISSLINQGYNHPGPTAVITSMKEHWRGLTLFVDDPSIPMDNNQAERILRTAVLGRKNYWGNHALWAGELTVAMFSLIQILSP